MGYRKSVVSAMSPHCSEMQIAPRRCMMRLNCESLHLNVLKREIWNVGLIAGLPTRHSNQVHPGECTRKGASPLLGSKSKTYPKLPSRLTLSSFCASTANSIGNARKTSLQNPLTIIETASSVEIPRWRQ